MINSDNSATPAASESCVLSAREKEVLQLISMEYTFKEIARILYISPYTAVSHRKNLLEKFKVRNTAGLVRRGFELGIL